MAYVKVWIHAVWTTKNRAPLLNKEIQSLVFNHILENANSKNIYIRSIGGYRDHVHCLFSLKPNQSIAKAIQLIKGETTFWINRQKLIRSNFAWQSEYFAISVSESGLKSVGNYIRNQEVHHERNTFSEEYKLFMKRYGFEAFPG